MIDKIIERLEEEIKKCGKNCVSYGIPRINAYKKAICIVKQVAEKESGWVNCKDRLPEQESLICNTRKDIMIGYAFEDNASETNFSAENDFEHMYDVIAWRPLPEPYKEAD